MNNYSTYTQPLFNATTTPTTNLTLTSGEPNYDMPSTIIHTTDNLASHQKILVFDSILALLFLVILSATFTIVIFYKADQERRSARNRNGRSGSRTTSMDAGDKKEGLRRELSLAEKIYEMSSEDRLRYYNELFKRNGNQLELTSDQIMITKTEGNDIEDGSMINPAQEMEEEDDPSLYLTLDNVSNHRSSKRKDTVVHDTTDYNNTTRRSSFLVLSKNNNNNHVRGNCIICFENFKPGDTIVHNTETKGCPHIYHKSCMVEYLSNQNRSIKQLKSTVDMDPTCPTCRQPFCKLLEPLLNNESSGDKMFDIPL